MMMSFCKKSLYSFLFLRNTQDNFQSDHLFSQSEYSVLGEKTETAPPAPGSSSTTAGLGIFTASADIKKPINVVESAAVKSPPSFYCPSTKGVSNTPTTPRPDTPRAPISRLDTLRTPSPRPDTPRSPTPRPDIRRASTAHPDTPKAPTPRPDSVSEDFLTQQMVDGLTSCTESLGFESSDERRVEKFDDNIAYNNNGKDSSSSHLGRRLRRWEAAERRKTKKFPPPISSLGQHGKPIFFLRSERKDGRLEIKQVKLKQPDTLLASRENGRLRLHLITNDDDHDETQEKYDQEDDEADEEEEEEKEENRVMEWKFPGTTKSRRCYGRHSFHHPALFVWRQPCA